MAAALLLPAQEDEAMGRIMLALGLAALAGCGGETAGSAYGSVLWTGTMTVSNQGTSALNGIAEDWNGPEAHFFSLNPGEVATLKFTNSNRVKLHAWRTSDGLLLIDDFWDIGELRDGVKVTLNP
jgi:hypothetical protein